MSWRIAIAAFAATVATAQTPEEFAAQYLERVPLAAIPAASDPQDFQSRFVAVLEKELGPVIGYKAALTNPLVQEQLGVHEPVLGFLLRDMMRPGAEPVPAGYGSRPIIEADLLVVVMSEAINEADSNGAFLNSIESVVPFIELADLGYSPDVKLTAQGVAFINAGARAGVMGAPVRLSGLPDAFQRLALLRCAFSKDGKLLTDAKGGALMGHPLDVVRWIRDDIRRRGMRLKAGDVLSLGSFSAPETPEPGATYVAEYYGLSPEGPVTVSVTVLPAPVSDPGPTAGPVP